ncbi:hypothetical protein TSUD_325510 [Trifolium subterraneum]|uniref:Uncharacterized protein n=1 Tax=Trifolium subterraneum TaxID=3900 RepID=A0A2Z6LL44_TRISU|nr:hypothetical protein TSUD_325510 [Trifolium subterraneum]
MVGIEFGTLKFTTFACLAHQSLAHDPEPPRHSYALRIAHQSLVLDLNLVLDASFVREKSEVCDFKYKKKRLF